MMIWSLEPDDALLASTSRLLGQGHFVTYKTVTTLYFFFWCIWWPYSNGDDIWEFVTYWSFYVSNVYFISSSLTAVLRLMRSAEGVILSDHEPSANEGGVAETQAVDWAKSMSEEVLLRIQLISWYIACPCTLVVLTIFWAALYSGGALSTTDYNAHLLVAIFLIVDQFLVATPYPLHALWFAEAYGIAYLTFNVTWYLSTPKGDGVIYSILDWGDSPWKAVMYIIIVLFVLLPSFTYLHNWLHRFGPADHFRLRRPRQSTVARYTFFSNFLSLNFIAVVTMVLCYCLPFSWFVPEDPALASTSRFLGARMFALYKLVLALYLIFWCFWWPLGEDISSGYKYTTYWSFYMLTLYFIISGYTAIWPPSASESSLPSFSIYDHNELGARKSSTDLPRWPRFILWSQIVLWNAGCISSFVVTLVYWVFLHGGEDSGVDTVDINAHLLGAIISVIDIMLVAAEFRFRHIVSSWLFAVVYFAFNIIYFLAGPEDDKILYTVLDWEDNPGGAAVFAVLTIFILVPLLNLACCGLFRLRECIYQSCYKRPSSVGKQGAGVDDMTDSAVVMGL